jgi:hypothetical protein
MNWTEKLLSLGKTGTVTIKAPQLLIMRMNITSLITDYEAISNSVNDGDLPQDEDLFDLLKHATIIKETLDKIIGEI